MYSIHTEVYRFARFFPPPPSFYTFLLPGSTSCCVPLLMAALHRSLELGAGCCPSPCCHCPSCHCRWMFVWGDQCVWLSPGAHFRLFLTADTAIHTLPLLQVPGQCYLLIIPWLDPGCMGECREHYFLPHVSGWWQNKFCPVKKVVRGHPTSGSCDISSASVLVQFLSKAPLVTEKTAERCQYLPIHVPWDLFWFL